MIKIAVNPWSKNQLDEMVILAAQNMTYAWSRAVFEDCFKPNYYGWVAVDDKQKIVGFVVGLVQLDVCQLLNICVSQAMQGQGVAQQLFATLLNADVINGKTIELEVRASNQRAIRFYQKLGFVETGRRKNYYPTESGREDAILMMLLPASL